MVFRQGLLAGNKQIWTRLIPAVPTLLLWPQQQLRGRSEEVPHGKKECHDIHHRHGPN